MIMAIKGILLTIVWSIVPVSVILYLVVLILSERLNREGSVDIYKILIDKYESEKEQTTGP